MPAMDTLAVILAAGLGSRLGRPHPKCLTRLANGDTILGRQLRLLRSYRLQPLIVVGFKLESILEAHPENLFIYNPNYDTTNTAKSLLCALQQINHRDVLWLNGDVVFDGQVIERLLNCGVSCVAVNNARVGEEEVKYTLGERGYIQAISKQVRNPRGESLGINLIKAQHLDAFRSALVGAGEQDYFEKAMEQAIKTQSAAFKAVDVSDLTCIEIDFAEDLEAANRLLDQ